MLNALTKVSKCKATSFVQWNLFRAKNSFLSLRLKLNTNK